jgi:translocator protein
MKAIKLNELPTLILCIIICHLAGVFGSIFTSSSILTWYPALVKPSFTPPGWIIGTVWVCLFTLMGISLFLVWRKGILIMENKKAIALFVAQLLANVLWSWAFFGNRSPLAGIIVIIVLWLLIMQTIIRFWPISRLAALLLVPYVSWVSFAAFLNYTILRLNS